ncbi:MAG: segregation/condensation protein A [Clostridia bacterium]|nr:segregation/condensation protein A [Clostridia bacterium]
MENISYKLDQFEGPLDLLLTLISKNKIDINDIPIAELCSQYMEYINHEDNRDIEIASEFIVMASELMLIKSRMLLPKQEDEEDPRASLVEAVLEYQRAKAAAAEMNLLYATYGLRMVKEQDEISVDKTYVADHEPDLLRRALERALEEVHINTQEVKERFEPIVNAPRVSVLSVASVLVRSIKKNGKLYLDDYFVHSRSRSEMIAKFMAVLELLRQGYVALSEESLDSETGVVDAASHIDLTLCGDVDEDKLAAMFEGEPETETMENNDGQ